MLAIFLKCAKGMEWPGGGPHLKRTRVDRASSSAARRPALPDINRAIGPRLPRSAPVIGLPPSWPKPGSCVPQTSAAVVIFSSWEMQAASGLHPGPGDYVIEDR